MIRHAMHFFHSKTIVFYIPNTTKGLQHTVKDRCLKEKAHEAKKSDTLHKAVPAASMAQ